VAISHVTTGTGDHHVLALHGWFGSAHGWGSFPEFLNGADFSYAFPDLRGYGARRDEPGEFTMEEAAADAVGLADDLGWDTFSVVGHSMGGVAAQHILLLAPGRVRRLVGITPVPAGGVPFGDEAWRLFTSAALSPQSRAAIVDFSTGARLSTVFIDSIVRHSLENSEQEAFGTYLGSWAKADIVGQVKGNPLPVKVIAGEHDPSLSPDMLEHTWLEHYPNAELEVIRNAGHYPMHETPVILATIVEEFLARGLQPRGGGDHFRADDLQRRAFPDPGDLADRGVEAHPGELPELLDGLVYPLALRARVEPEVHALADRVVVAAHRVAVLAEHVELVSQVGSGEQVRRVGVLRDQPESLLLAATADHDRGVRPGQGLRRVERTLEVIVPPVVRSFVATPHPQGDLERLLQPFEPLGDRREIEPEAAGLLLVPGGADAEPGAPIREDIEGRDDLGEQTRLPVDRSGDQGEQLRPPGVGGQVAERRVSLKHGVLGGANPADLEKVVHDGHHVESALVGGAGRPGQVLGQRRRAARVGEVWNLETKFHAPRLSRRPWWRVSRPPPQPARGVVPYAGNARAGPRGTFWTPGVIVRKKLL
jgi:pimeloyl-ACP methyl ester carboxylesterase